MYPFSPEFGPNRSCPCRCGGHKHAAWWGRDRGCHCENCGQPGRPRNADRPKFDAVNAMPRERRIGGLGEPKQRCGGDGRATQECAAVHCLLERRSLDRSEKQKWNQSEVVSTAQHYWNSQRLTDFFVFASR